MASPALPLSDIVDITVQIAPQNPALPTFNQALVVGATTGTTVTHANRLQQFTSLSGMLTAGYTTSSPEYIAASLYFAQFPQSPFLWVGFQDKTSLNTIIPHSGNAGTGYVVGDVITVIQGLASGGQAKVTSIGGGGAVTGLSVLAAPNDGTGYSVATGLTTTGGSGTGLEVDITVVGETPLQAVTACRNVGTAWYACMFVGTATDADHEAIALFAQSALPPMCYFITTSDANVLNNVAGNLCATLQAADYNRVFTMYATTQGGAAPNNVYASAAVMGVAMGLNTGLAGSYFTLMFKALVGVIAEPLTQAQVSTLCGNPGFTEGINCNVYVGYANVYTFLQQGTMANGQFFDEILGLDMLISGMQFGVADLLVDLPSVPQTDPGQTQIIHQVNQACEAARIRGFIAGGTWEGVQILNLTAGQTLPNGYLAQSPAYATQLASNRALRQSMPVYVAIIEAGAANCVIIGVYVQR